MAIDVQSQTAWVGSGDIRITADGQQQKPAVAALTGGGYVVAWVAYTFVDGLPIGEVHAQIYDASGAAVGAELLLSDGPATGIPTLSGLADGGFVATWEDPDVPGSPTSRIEYTARLFDAAGAPVSPEFQVDTVPDVDQGTFAEVTALADGGFVVEWFGNPGGPTYWGPSLQVFDAAGEPIGGSVAVGYAADGSVLGGDASVGGATIAATPDGGYVSVWNSFSAFQPDTGYTMHTYVQRFDSDGHALSQPLVVMTASSNTLGIFGGQFGDFDAAVLENGDLVITLVGQTTADSVNHVITQRVDAAGNALGTPLDISVGFSTVLDAQVTALSDGGFVVSWLDWTAGESPIMAQRYDSAGATVGEPVLVGVASAALPHYSVTATAGGGAVFAWEDIRIDGGDIFVELFSGPGGQGGTLQGGNGTDDLIGTAGADLLQGGNGRDFLTGLGGDDVLDGGRGLDTAIYTGVMADYMVTRTEQGFTVSGLEGMDTLSGIERLQFADAQVALNEHAPPGQDIVVLVGVSASEAV